MLIRSIFLISLQNRKSEYKKKHLLTFQYHLPLLKILNEVYTLLLIHT